MRLNADQASLVAENYDLASRMSRAPQRSHPRLRDAIESNACLGLIRAALAFDPARSGNFRMVASFYIRSAMGDAVRVGRNDARREAGPLLESDAPSRDPSPESAAISAEEPARFERRLASLAGPQAEVCRAVYARGETDAEAARRMGFSADTGRRLRRRALAILDGSRPSPRIAEIASCPRPGPFPADSSRPGSITSP